MEEWSPIAVNSVKKKELADLIIKKNCIVVRKTPIKLASGIMSDHYYNIKSVSLDPIGSKLIGELGIELISQLSVRPKSIGGLETGAVPIITTIVKESNNTPFPIPGFFVRKEKKDHGLPDMDMIDGNRPESPVLIVDDVTTTGESVSKAIKQVQKAQYKILGVVTIIDRQEGSYELFRNLNIPLYPLFTDNYFRDYLAEKRSLGNQEIKSELH